MKSQKLVISLIISCVVLLLIIVAGISFYLGIQHQRELVQLLRNEQAIRENDYSKSLDVIRKERDRALGDYITSCYEYKKLRSAYDDIYLKSGEASGTPKYTSPDDARGNEESCYR